MCTLGECLCTVLFGTFAHRYPGSFLVEGEHLNPTLCLRWDWLCQCCDLSAARQCKVALGPDDSLAHWHWIFNIEPLGRQLHWDLSGWYLLFGLVGAIAGTAITGAYQ